MEIPAPPDLSVELGPDGFAAQLSHPLAPAVGGAREPARHVVLDYLDRLAQARHLPISSSDLEYLRRTADGGSADASADTRLAWLPERLIKRNGMLEATIVFIQQRAWSQDAKAAIPIEGSGIRIVCQHNPKDEVLRITGASSTLRKDTSVSDAASKALVQWFALERLAASRLAASSFLALHFGLEEGALDNAHVQLVAFDPTDARTYTATADKTGPSPELTIGLKLEANHATRQDDPAAFRAFLDLATRKVSPRQVLASACSGLSFSIDPVSKTGSGRVRPDSSGGRLDPLRNSCRLDDLAVSSSGEYSLSGPRVAVKDPNPLGFPVPKSASSFDFPSRTNEFAAVSAYAHCDAMMQMVESFGFELDSYFPVLPITVVHRAPLRITAARYDGKAVAAYVQGLRANKTDPMALEMRFALGDLTDHHCNPLGVAADIRWVWHEFSHVLLAASTGELEFPFAHSAGDALAAIMCDPDSKLSTEDSGRWRGVTFPFVSSPLRRHDRETQNGWGWKGSLYDEPPHYPSIRDPSGYRGEQVLSSTLFRLYRAIGGDALRSNGTPDRLRRRAAARYVAYLIVRAIRSLGSASSTPARNANVLASALIDADIGTREFADGPSRRLGGSLHKVIRWAFQQQGLYHAGSRKHDAPGDNPAVDIYVDRATADADGYAFTDDWLAKPTAVWARNADDGGAGDEAPRLGNPNFLYIEVGNQGTSDATAVSVDVLTRPGAGHDVWENSGVWQIVPPTAGAVVQSNIGRGRKIRFGPFVWTPNFSGPHGIFVRASAPGDRSNADANSFLACATGPIPMRELVPFDNNLAYRNLQVS
jgi:hypothetical protein